MFFLRSGSASSLLTPQGTRGDVLRPSPTSTGRSPRKATIPHTGVDIFETCVLTSRVPTATGGVKKIEIAKCLFEKRCS